MPAATLASDAWSLLQECQKAEAGLLYCGTDGAINFYERYAIVEDSTFTTRNHSFTASGAGATSPILHVPFSRTLGSIHNVTRVTASRNGGATTFVYDTTAASTPSVTPANGPHDLHLSFDASIETAAAYWHKGWDFSGERVDAFNVRVAPTNDGSQDQLRGLEAGHYEPLNRCEIQTQPIGFGTDWNFEARIEGYTLTATASTIDAAIAVSAYSTDSIWYFSSAC